jgi:hypothetical protein
MRRRLFTLCCAVSAALSLAVLLLWLRSHRTVDFLTLLTVRTPAAADGAEDGVGSYTARSASSIKGVLTIHSMTVVDRAPLDERPLTWRTEPAAPFMPPPQNRPVSYSSSATVTTPIGWSRGQITGSKTLRLRYWVLAVPPAVLPAAWIIWRVRTSRIARRDRLGLCRRCGYDLRATPGRCPECGAMPERGAGVVRSA